MIKSLLTNTAVYSAGRILPQLTGFILLPLYTDKMSPAEYGIVQSMQVLGFVLLIVFSLAIDRSLARLYYDYEKEVERKMLIGNSVIITSLFSTFSLIAIIVFKDYFGQIYESIPFYPYYFFILGNTFLAAFIQIPTVILQVKGKSILFLAISLLQLVFSVFFIVLFVVYRSEGAIGMLKGQFFGSLLLSPFIFYLIFEQSIFRIRHQMLKNILSYSIPILPILIFGWVMNMANRIFIERYGNLTDVGLYSIASKVSDIPVVLFSSIYVAYSPIFYQISNDKSTTEIQKKGLLSGYNNAINVLIIFFSFCLAFLSKEIIEWFLNKQYWDSWHYIIIFSYTNIFIHISSLSNLMIYQMKKTKMMLLLTLISATINLGLNFLLIPAYGALGAAFSGLITYVFFFVLKFAYSRKTFYIPFDWMEITFLLITTLILLFGGFYIQKLPLIYSVLIKSILIFLLAFALLYRKKDIILRLIKGRNISNEK